MMKHTRLCIYPMTLLLLALGLPGLLSAQPANPQGSPPQHAGPPQEIVDDLLARGFRRVEPSVFQRPLDDGSFETVAFGAEGHWFLLRQLQARLDMLEGRQREAPLAERLDAILALEQRIEELQQIIQEARAEGAASAVTLGSEDLGLSSIAAAAAVCDTSVHRLADSSPTTSGPKAHGEASFTDTCGDAGNVIAQCYVEGVLNGNATGKFDNCSLPGTGSASCACTANVTATSKCFSDADAQVSINVQGGTPVTWAVSNTGFVCRALSATLTGPAYLFVPAFTCTLGTWTVTASGGTGAYTYEWRLDGAVVGNGTSLTQQYCNDDGFGFTFTDIVSVKVTDSSGASVTRSLTVNIEFEEFCTLTICDPCYVGGEFIC